MMKKILIIILCVFGTASLQAIIGEIAEGIEAGLEGVGRGVGAVVAGTGEAVDDVLEGTGRVLTAPTRRVVVVGEEPVEVVETIPGTVPEVVYEY